MPDAPGYSTDHVLAALLLSLDEGALIFDDQAICRAAGRRAGEIFGLDPSAVVGLSRTDLLGRAAAAAEAPEVLGPLAAEALSSERTVVDPIALVRPSHRTVVWTSVPVAAGGRLDLIRDVTRERRAEATIEMLGRRLEMESTHDDLTGLTNRRRFEEECAREHRRAQREWISYAIARFDVDGMGEINQRLGYEVGSELLKHIGEALRSNRREYDVVARWKDDEFMVLLPRADMSVLRSVLRRARDGVHAKGRELVPELTVSVGAAVWTPPSAEGPPDIVLRAESALAAARARGKGKIDIDQSSAAWKADDGDGGEG